MENENQEVENPEVEATQTAQGDETATPDNNAEHEIIKEEAKIEIMQKELDEIESNLDADFKKDFESLLSEEEKYFMEVGSDISAKLELMNVKKAQYYEEKLSQKKQQLSDGKSELDVKKQTASNKTAANAFLAEHKDVSLEELEDFADNDMSTRQITQMRESAGEDKVARMKFVYELFKAANPSQEEDDNLPPDLNALRGATAAFNQDDNKDEEYLKSIGVA